MPRKRVTPNETSQERFKRIAEARTNSVLDKIRLLGNLADRRRYGYASEDVDKIFASISRQLREVRAKFRYKDKARFKL